MGNRWQILTELAQRFYPKEMDALKDPTQKEALATELLADHNVKTVEVGSGCFKFSYLTVEIDGVKKGVLAMRMPNGSLAYEATKLLLENGTKKIVMIGAGGSMDKEAGVGSYQRVIASSYQNEERYIRSENQMRLELSGMTVKEDRKNITVDSPLVENDAWMKSVAEEDISSVDVETFHIFKAFNESVESGNGNIQILSGLFTSDVVGESPLEAKINSENAWKALPTLLKTCFDALKVQQVADTS